MIDTHAHALEAFNRATHVPPTPEIQIAPAEELQADLPLHGATVPLWLYAVSLALGFAAVALVFG